MEDRFRAAAYAYLGYGVVYWIGGVYLALHGVGVRGGPRMQAGLGWVVIGLILVALIPYLLSHPRAWFERWLVSRRDFARLLVLLMAVRAYHVGRVAVRPDPATVAAPRGGELWPRCPADAVRASTSHRPSAGARGRRSASR